MNIPPSLLTLFILVVGLAMSQGLYIIFVEWLQVSTPAFLAVCVMGGIGLGHGVLRLLGLPEPRSDDEDR